MRTGGQLNFRYQEILNSIVRSYIETGEPVSSRTISKLRHNALSPASIRNVMADLADEGYLAQPHTSAGRIPTDKAFRDFVETVPSAPLSAFDRQLILSAMANADSLEERVDSASRILGQM